MRVCVYCASSDSTHPDYRKDAFELGALLAQSGCTVVYGGGALYLNMYRASAKAKNLGRDDRICCVLTTPYDAERFQGALYKGHARELSVEEVFADQVPEGLAWARNPRSGGSQEQPDIPPEETRKIGDTAGRIKRGKRMVFEISPDLVGWVGDVREV